LWNGIAQYFNVDFQRRQVLPETVMQFARDAAAFIVLHAEDASTQLTGRLFRLLASRNVGANFEPSRECPGLVAQRRPAAGNADLRAIALPLPQLALPVIKRGQMRQWDGELGAQQLVRRSLESLALPPAVKTFSAAVPVRNSVVSITHKDSVVRQVEKLCLFRNLLRAVQSSDLCR